MPPWRGDSGLSLQGALVKSTLRWTRQHAFGSGLESLPSGLGWMCTHLQQAGKS
jgi:hypothetical protein